MKPFIAWDSGGDYTKSGGLVNVFQVTEPKCNEITVGMGAGHRFMTFVS